MTNRRPETGPMTFDGDWRGTFIRGDNSKAFMLALHTALEHPETLKRDILGTRAVLKDLLKLLARSDERHPNVVPQMLKPFDQCTMTAQTDDESSGFDINDVPDEYYEDNK